MNAVEPTSPESLSTPLANSVLLSLGSNIEPDRHLFGATRLLASRVRVVAASQVFETVPVGTGDGPPFLNAAVEILCDLEPRSLKHGILRPLEQEMGRIRSNDPNAPRTIDMDISLFGDCVLQDEESGLEIPDPEILCRAHVAIPLADVAPETLHPVAGLKLREIAQRLDWSGVRVFPGLVLWPQSDRL